MLSVRRIAALLAVGFFVGVEANTLRDAGAQARHASGRAALAAAASAGTQNDGNGGWPCSHHNGYQSACNKAGCSWSKDSTRNSGICS